jgi:hypothetical protein
METQNRYISRLTKLADHLNANHIYDLIHKKRKQFHCDDKGADIDYFSWALKDLPLLFKQWGYGPDGNPRLDGYERLNTLSAAAIFFKLDFDSLPHLFVAGYQNTLIYGGEMLSDSAKPHDLLSNMYEYISRAEDKEEEKVEVKRNQGEAIFKNLKNQKDEKSNILSRMRA